jgi:hypothetical protein
MEGLTLFDKIRLAQCAAERAKDHLLDQDRFLAEYQTTALWKHHSTYYTVTKDGKVFNYKVAN